MASTSNEILLYYTCWSFTWDCAAPYCIWLILQRRCWSFNLSRFYWTQFGWSFKGDSIAPCIYGWSFKGGSIALCIYGWSFKGGSIAPCIYGWSFKGDSIAQFLADPSKKDESIVPTMNRRFHWNTHSHPSKEILLSVPSKEIPLFDRFSNFVLAIIQNVKEPIQILVLFKYLDVRFHWLWQHHVKGIHILVINWDGCGGDEGFIKGWIPVLCWVLGSGYVPWNHNDS